MRKGMFATGTNALAIVAIGFTGLMGSTANAAGFEKSIVWGGRSSGVAGIATPYVQGADALYFNPAGLAGDKEGQTLSFNISPTQSQFKGPINNANDTSESTAKLLTPFGLIYGNTISDKMGFAVGAFVSGGANANFQDVSFSAPSGYKAEVKTDLQIFEASAGLGYKVDENLKLGLAWRVVMAQADFSFVKRNGGGASTVANAKLTGLKDTQAVAFRFGAQYKLDEATELGLNFRSEVNFKASGKVAGQVFSPVTAAGAANFAIAEADATARTTLPMAVTLGAIHKLSEEWNLLGEYSWTQYSRIGEIPVETSSTVVGNTSLKTDWRDQHNLRVGAEYLAMAWPIRYGYGYTSTVTNSDYARASFTPPGPAHTLTLGTGQDFAMGEQNLRFDAGFEYTMTSGDSTNGAAAGAGGAGTDTRAGTYSASAYVAHLGLTYAF